MASKLAKAPPIDDRRVRQQSLPENFRNGRSGSAALAPRSAAPSAFVFHFAPVEADGRSHKRECNSICLNGKNQCAAVSSFLRDKTNGSDGSDKLNSDSFPFRRIGYGQHFARGVEADGGVVRKGDVFQVD